MAEAGRTAAHVRTAFCPDLECRRTKNVAVLVLRSDMDAISTESTEIYHISKSDRFFTLQRSRCMTDSLGSPPGPVTIPQLEKCSEKK
jgi:hypothetical protein